jgi:hypothetical protein
MKDTSNQKFLSILNNVNGASGKDRGVLLLVSSTRDLRPLEEACFAPDQSWNSVVTARYTLSASAPEDVFGTLARSLVTDVSNWSGSGSPDLSGTLREFASEQLKQFTDPITWPALQPFARAIDDAIPSDDGAYLDTSVIAKAMGRTLAAREEWQQKGQKAYKVAKDGGDFLHTGHRLVVFLQLDGDMEESETWSDFLDKLADILPYRTMLVIAGLPDEVELDPNVPTQRRLILHPEQVSEVESAEKKEAVVAYKENAAISDEPTTSNELGRRPYANALALMVLHKQTVPPLSVGIHGPWGKGKSSFMAQIREELVKEGKAGVIPIVTVDFNAWRYDDATQVWAGLLNKVSAEVEKKLGYWRTLRINTWHAVRTRTAELFWAAALPCSYC